MLKYRVGHPPANNFLRRVPSPGSHRVTSLDPVNNWWGHRVAHVYEDVAYVTVKYGVILSPRILLRIVQIRAHTTVVGLWHFDDPLSLVNNASNIIIRHPSILHIFSDPHSGEYLMVPFPHLPRSKLHPISNLPQIHNLQQSLPRYLEDHA